MAHASLALGSAIALVCLVATVQGHGHIKEPKSRGLMSNLYASWDAKDYDINANVAGGPDTVKANGGGADWPGGKNGVCGDVYGSPNPKYLAGGLFAPFERYGWGGLYTVGQTVKVEIVMTAPHGGYWEFRICKYAGDSHTDEAGVLTDACLDQHKLLKPDGSDKHWIRADSPTGSYTVDVKLPDGLECDGQSHMCVMQWHWVTGNSCHPPGTDMDPANGICWGNCNMPTCGTPETAYPEEFWCVAHSPLDSTLKTRSKP